ncbi:hypothetical protein MalM25_19060 [Planctomycetes bacterium MalM25]|nr:hypothetical protein MalM25_19060 [Planctomycetes bacterium MalM25]
MKRYLFPAAAAALVAVLASPQDAAAQNNWSQFAVDNEWSNNSNWDVGFAPDPAFDTEAVIGSTTLGAATTATVNVNGALTTPTVQIGQGGGTSGTVTIGAGQSLTAVADLSEGDFFIGGSEGGLGVLNVAGTLAVAREIETPTDADFNSTLSLSGSASVTAAYGFLDRQFRIAGPSVSFSTTGSSPGGDGLILGGGGVHTWEFGAGGVSTLNVSSNLDLGGTLAIETPGFTPSAGDTYVLADSGSVDANDATPSGFDNIDTSGVPGLMPGTIFTVGSVAGGVNGVQTVLSVSQAPVLTVNRQTGEAKLKNFSGSGATLNFDVYTVRSDNGSLAPGSLGGLGGDWVIANPTANGLAEISPTSDLALAASQEMSLGAIFAPAAPAEFGDSQEDLSFDIGTPSGELINVPVVYEGMPNDTLVLNVDPSTGEAQMLNPSGFEVAIDAYVISSDSGSLEDLTWSSLDDTGADGGNWFEANVSDSQLAELLTVGGATMDANQGVTVDIGTPYDTAGEQDLVFQFALVGEEFLRTGKVVYGSQVSAVGLAGDYNEDGVVDAADYTVWRDAGANDVLPNDTTPGTVGPGDYTVWKSNYGATASSLATAVPEPASAVLSLGLLTIVALRRRG